MRVKKKSNFCFSPIWVWNHTSKLEKCLWTSFYLFTKQCQGQNKQFRTSNLCANMAEESGTKFDLHLKQVSRESINAMWKVWVLGKTLKSKEEEEGKDWLGSNYIGGNDWLMNVECPLWHPWLPLFALLRPPAIMMGPGYILSIIFCEKAVCWCFFSDIMILHYNTYLISST